MRLAGFTCVVMEWTVKLAFVTRSRMGKLVGDDVSRIRRLLGLAGFTCVVMEWTVKLVFVTRFCSRRNGG